MNPNRKVIKERSVYAIKIDATNNADENTCTLHVAPDLFCSSKGGFWPTFFLYVWVSIATVFVIAFGYNYYSASTIVDPFKLTTFGMVQIALFSTIEIADIGLDMRQALY